jgi:NAD(P)-dependent dehydrogenase (short-subunit alcohol dehydrogenase family)
MGILEEKIAVITGGGQGIGKEIAKRFALENATVLILDTDENSARETVNEIGGRASAFFARIEDQESINRIITDIAVMHKKIDILVNNAAITGKKSTIINTPLEEWEKVIRINLTGTFIVSKAVIPIMIANGKGSIINIGSQLGSVAIPESVAYCSSKGALLQMTRALSLDHASDGIRVNSISPGAVLTEKLVRIYGSVENAKRTLAPKHPIGRIGYPNEIAGAAVFLASEESAFMTGADLVIDGGYLSQ